MGNTCSRVFCCCCGRSRYEQADAHTQPLAVLSTPQNTLAGVLERSIQARSAAWAQLGKTRRIPTTHLKASANSERQKWPSVRQSYQLVERGNGTTILASDGLSDPFDDITLGTLTTSGVLLLIGRSAGQEEHERRLKAFVSLIITRRAPESGPD